MASCECLVNGYKYIDKNDSIKTEINIKIDISIKIREEFSYSCLTLNLFNRFNSEETPLKLVKCNIRSLEYYVRALEVFGKTKIFIKLKSVSFKWEVLVVKRKVKGNMDLALRLSLAETLRTHVRGH